MLKSDKGKYIKAIGAAVILFFAAPAMAAPWEVVDKLKEIAATDYPDNYSVQNYSVKRQIKAYDTLQTLQPPIEMPYDVFQRLKDNAARDFPNNYSVQLYQINRQTKAYIELHK